MNLTTIRAAIQAFFTPPSLTEHIAHLEKENAELKANNEALKEGKKVYWKALYRVTGMREQSHDPDNLIYDFVIENMNWYGEFEVLPPFGKLTTEKTAPRGTWEFGQKVPFEGGARP